MMDRMSKTGINRRDERLCELGSYINAAKVVPGFVLPRIQRRTKASCCHEKLRTGLLHGPWPPAGALAPQFVHRHYRSCDPLRASTSRAMP